MAISVQSAPLASLESEESAMSRTECRIGSTTTLEISVRRKRA